MKLTIMRGLPASGKTTRAREILADGNTVRVNKDTLRTMLHFDKWSNRNEAMTRAASIAIVREMAAKGHNVVVDDTNLNPTTFSSWQGIGQELGARVVVEDLSKVPVEECWARDNAREKRVGMHVISKMALQYLQWLSGEDVVVSDLDGTLCHIGHRLHHVRKDPKDWKSFFEGIPGDGLREDVRDMVAKARTLILVTARPESYRAQTEEWLTRHGINYTALIMREDGDSRQDTDVKAEMYQKYLKHLTIKTIYDDRPSVIKMWRKRGLHVVDVGMGIDF